MIDKTLNYGRHLIKKFLKQNLPYGTVLDMGAGHGDDLLYVKSISPQTHLVAIESHPPYVQELREKGVTVYSYNIEREKLPFEDQTVDVIVINQVFEHVKEVFWILHEISRVLKVGGHLVVGVPNLASMHNRFLLVLGKQPTCIQNDSAHLRGYTKNDFRQLLNSGFPGGYSLQGFGGSNFYPFPRAIAKPLAGMFPTMAWGIFMNWRKEKPYATPTFLRFVEEKKLETNFYLGK